MVCWVRVRSVEAGLRFTGWAFLHCMFLFVVAAVVVVGRDGKDVGRQIQRYLA